MPARCCREVSAAAPRMMEAGLGPRPWRQRDRQRRGSASTSSIRSRAPRRFPTAGRSRLQSFDIDEIPVVNLYKYEQDRYGNRVLRFLSFANDEEHELGETPHFPTA